MKNRHLKPVKKTMIKFDERAMQIATERSKQENENRQQTKQRFEKEPEHISKYIVYILDQYNKAV